MLVIFNLDWKSHDIDQRVNRAAHSLNAVIAGMGAGHYVQYDLASLGAGEQIFWKTTPPEKRIPAETMDFIRQQHAAHRAELDQDPQYRRYRDTAEMLNALKGDRHRLAAVFHGETAECDELLRKAHLRRYFDALVYGVDSLTVRKPALADLYAAAIGACLVSPDDDAYRRNDNTQTLIVDQTLDGIRSGNRTDALVAGFIPPGSCPDDEIAARGAEMRDAGAAFIATTTTDITVLPGHIGTRPGPWRGGTMSYLGLPPLKPGNPAAGPS